MLKRIDYILNIVMASFAGVTIGHGIFQYLDYRKYPDLYAMQSAPWYTSTLLYAGVTAAVLAAAVIVKCVLKRKFSDK